jgi:hypothetical protein
MGVRITNATEAVLYCSTTMWAFGPVFADYDEAEEFLTWSRENVAGDLRLLTDAELEKVAADWRAARNVEAEHDPELRADLDDFIRTSEWVKESNLRAKERAAAKELRARVQELKRAYEALEAPSLRDYAVEGDKQPEREIKIDVSPISLLVYRGQHNYVASVDGEEEWGSATGETEEQARKNLIEQLEETERICRR